MLMVPCVTVSNSCTVCNASDLIAIVPPNKVDNTLFSTNTNNFPFILSKERYTHHAMIRASSGVLSRNHQYASPGLFDVMLGYKIGAHKISSIRSLTVVVHLNNVALPSLALKDDRRVG